MTATAAAALRDFPAADPGHPALPLLDRVRRLAMDCRLAPRLDADRYCALLRAEKGPAGAAHLSGLMRLLPIALGRRAVFHRPGAREMTFDEAWLLRLVASIRAGDRDSVAFALASRVPRHLRAPIRFLAEGLANALDEPSLELF